jgi:hypothetical protein
VVDSAPIAQIGPVPDVILQVYANYCMIMQVCGLSTPPVH